MSSASAWDDVWERKGAAAVDAAADRLTAAIIADGFDSPGAGGVGPDDFRQLAAGVAAAVGMGAGDSAFEVGCGTGAFLASLDDVMPGLRLTGCDRSASLIDVGRSLFPEFGLEVADAAEFPHLPDVDHVVSCSVFHYFPDHDYADRVISRMVSVAGRSVVLLDLPDAASRAKAEVARRGPMSEEEFAERYSGLHHLYYDREWVAARFAPDEWQVRITDQTLTRYPNAPYRFNVVAVRHRAPSRPSVNG